MVVHARDLSPATFKNMGARETVKGLPGDGRLTQKQLALMVLIHQSDTRGASQIRDYNDRSYSTGTLPSSSVAHTLEDKGMARVGRRKQVSRRTGRGTSGFEKKKEGGYVNLTRDGREVVNAFASALGVGSARSDRLRSLAEKVLS